VQYGQKRWYSPGMPISLAADDTASLTIRLPRWGAITGAVLDENDVGMPGHEVAVYTDTRPPRLLARARTDDRGIYRLFDLRPGSYLVRSLASQFEDESYLPTFYRDSLKVEEAHPIEVKLDEQVEHMDFRAAPGRLFTVSGNVASRFRELIVTLSSDAGTETASVDETGNFSFNPMAPGQYELLAEVPGDRLRARMAGFRTLTVDRDLTDIRIPLSPLPAVQFVVEDTGGHPVDVPDGSLMVRRKDASGEGKPEPLQMFAKVVLLPGRWDIALTPDSHHCVTGFVAPQSEIATHGRADAWNEILLAPGSQNVVKFVLSRSPATIGGSVKNSNGDPVAGVPVFIEPSDIDPRQRLEQMRAATTDGKGRYQLGGLAPGVYRLLASFDYQMPDSAQMEAAHATTVQVEEAAHAVLDLEEFVIH